MRWDDIDKQVCSVARALSVVGERWTMLIIRDAFLGTRRFDQFQANLGITRHRLSERLGKLVEQGVLVKVPYHDRPVRYEYRLTRKGLGLYPVLMSLARWGDEWMDKGEGAPLEYVHHNCGKQDPAHAHLQRVRRTAAPGGSEAQTRAGAQQAGRGAGGRGQHHTRIFPLCCDVPCSKNGISAASFSTPDSRKPFCPHCPGEGRATTASRLFRRLPAPVRYPPGCRRYARCRSTAAPYPR